MSGQPDTAAAAAADGDAVRRAVAALRNGDPVLVHDATDREGEVDLLQAAGAVTPADVARLRADGGGLLFVALGREAAAALDLPFLADAVDHPAVGGDLAYDDRSSFSLPVNHRSTRTGVTDGDRARTISRLADHAADPDPDRFADAFRVPGHVHLLRDAGLDRRQGHTELAVALAEAAGLPPAVAGCEMLADADGALDRAAAKRYAERHGLPYVEGSRIVAELG
jgi:3,4-dihydroxy 2-butanone 4-phosphate synthase